MIDTDSAVHQAATDLGIDLNSTDEGSSLETETESMEAEGEVKNEEGQEPEQEEVSSEEAPSLEDEGEKAQPPMDDAPKTVKEIEEIKVLTQQLELKEKAFMERMQAQEMEFQKQHHEKLKAHDELDSFLAELAANDSDLFDLVKGAFQEHQKQFNNPVINSLKQKNEELEKKLDSFLGKASDEVTRTKLDAEINQVKATIGKEAEASGLKIDWTKVEDTWADNPKLSIEGAVFALYGANMMKAAASKAKVETVTKKVQARPAVNTAGNVKSSSQKAPSQVPSDAFGAVQYFAKQFMK